MRKHDILIRARCRLHLVTRLWSPGKRWQYFKPKPVGHAVRKNTTWELRLTERVWKHKDDYTRFNFGGVHTFSHSALLAALTCTSEAKILLRLHTGSSQFLCAG